MFAFFNNRHQEVLFTGPQSMDDMRKSKSAVDVKDQVIDYSFEK